MQHREARPTIRIQPLAAIISAGVLIVLALIAAPVALHAFEKGTAYLTPAERFAYDTWPLALIILGMAGVGLAVFRAYAPGAPASWSG